MERISKSVIPRSGMELAGIKLVREQSRINGEGCKME